MPGALRDVNDVAHILQRWIAQRIEGAVHVGSVAAAEGGSSSETYLVDLTVDGARQHRVLRIEASGFQVYQDASVERQFRVMEALGRTSTIPVPAMHWYEPDEALFGRPFFLMDRVDGRAPPNDYHNAGIVAEASPARREAMWRDGVEWLAAIHKADPAPFAFLSRPDLGTTGFEQEIARWDRYRAWTALPSVPAIERGRRWLEDHLPAPTPVSLAWGDARLSNFLFEKDRVSAVLDWETASLGGGESDLGWWLYYDHSVTAGCGTPRLDGIGDRAATIALWEAAVGRKAQALEWHEAFATWRFACISERAIALALARDAALPISSGDGNPAVRRMAELIG